MGPSDDDIAAATQAESIPESAGPEVVRRGEPSQRGSLTDPEKVRLWQQRFFEAQASAEEYLMELGGMPAIDAWIEANSSITARRFALLEPAVESRAAYAVARFVNQLLCYDSDISQHYDEATNSYEITNWDCGILHYRREAALARVRLTFESPCEYCTRLNSKIMQKYVQNSAVEVDYKNAGCEWRLVLPSDGTGE
jgi:hypothetical protein